MASDDADVATSIRLPRELLARADAVAERRAARLGERASRSAVLRLALERGIGVLEREAAALDASSSKAAMLAELEALRVRVAALAADGGS
jgi:predicted DNA-binding protein